MTDLRLQNIGDLTGRVAIVTGGGTGIGQIIAKAFAANGAKVYITGRRLEVLQKSAAATEGLHVLQLDVTDKESIRKAVAHVEATDKKLDILVNCAGISGAKAHWLSNPSAPEHENVGRSLFEGQDMDEWHSIFKTNTFAPFWITNAFLALLHAGAKTRPGETSSVINISSTTATMKIGMNNFAYGTSKCAVEHLTVVLASEYARQEIPVRVNCISPGGFPSELLNFGDPSVLDSILSKPLPGCFSPAPVKRAGREPEMAMTAVYLASSAGGFTNGIVLRADGGHHLLNP